MPYVHNGVYIDQNIQRQSTSDIHVGRGKAKIMEGAIFFSVVQFDLQTAGPLSHVHVLIVGHSN